MTTETDIDPRLVCLACGWEVSENSNGWVGDYYGERVGWLDRLCKGTAHLADVLEALEPRRPSLMYMARHGMWECMAWGLGTRATAPTPHEAVYALATKIGRSMEASQ